MILKILNDDMCMTRVSSYEMSGDLYLYGYPRKCPSKFTVKQHITRQFVPRYMNVPITTPRKFRKSTIVFTENEINIVQKIALELQVD